MAALLIWLGGDLQSWLATPPLATRRRAWRCASSAGAAAYFAALYLVGHAFAPRAQRGRGIIAMEFIRGLQGLKPKHRGAAITVGSFDGIHLGHGALIAQHLRAGEAARRGPR